MARNLAASRYLALTLCMLAYSIVAMWLVNPERPSAWAQEQKKATTPAEDVGAVPADWTKTLDWRCIGPANMGGRITAISVYEADPCIYYVATASGGLLKTINNGVTFAHQFDKEATVSIGDVCVAPSNPNIVWIGTGENNPRNSVSYGDGVYKSTDGGKSWKNMGLKESFQIGRVVIHPKDPNIVYVGALGRLYGPNPERGLFKTIDGGLSWEKVLYLDENTGIIDVQMHPTDPDTLLVAAWERKRDGFDSYLGPDLPEGMDGYDPIKKWGPKAGIYKTTDGGKTFNKLTKGLPTSQFGRTGLDYFRKNPNTIYAIIDCEKIGMGTPPKKKGGNAYLGIVGESVDQGAKVNNVVADGPAAKAGLLAGDIIQAVDKKKVASYEEFLSIVGEHAPGDKLMLQVLRNAETKDIAVTLGERPTQPGGKGGFGPGGPKKGRPYHAYYGGQKENVQSQQGPDAHEYGGVYKSTDGGESWTRVNSLNPRPMYFSLIRVDPTDDKYVYVGGIQMHRSSDGGKSFNNTGGKGVHADHHAMWIDPRDGRHMLLGCDGGTYVTYDRMNNWDHLNHMAMAQFYHVAISLKRPYWVFGGLQDNGTWGGPSIGLKGGLGPINEDWVSIFGGDGYVCRVDPTDPDMIYYEMQDGGMGRRHLRTGEQARIRPERAKDQPPHRFNWNTPFILSNHNPRIYYCGGEYVFRSVNRGDDLKIISPEITLTKRGSATALAESPKNADVLWAGTDDGALWITKDGGKNWKNVVGSVGLPGPRYVATIEASKFKEGRAYVAFDAHRSNDDKPYLYVTEDFGETWNSITANLPAFGSTRCLREDVVKENVLYTGTEFGIFASIDRGKSWTRINNDLPTVAVHEIALHPTAGELVAATHGRSIWILDIAPLRQMTPQIVKEGKPHLYKPQTVTRWQTQPAHGKTNRRYVGENPKSGANIYFSVAQPAQKASLTVRDVDGKVVATLTAPTKAGLHKINWNLVMGDQTGGGKGFGGKGFGGKGFGGKEGGEKGGAKGAGGKGFGGKGGQPTTAGGQPTAPRQVPSGDYRVVLTIDGVELSQSFRIEGDPNAPPLTRVVEEEEID
ncbi:MAG: PDZ domain-containing protein [Gemmataceae bacterium]|nr:PDZ domain-containing protein [Gemmataceae bacterium]